MGLFSKDEDDIFLENADLDCEPQGPSVTKSAVAKLDEYLSPGENVHYVATGMRFSIDNGDEEMMNHRLALTDKQMLLKRKQLFNIDVKTFNYEDISSVSLRKGMVHKK